MQKLKKIPKFKSYEEENIFWQTHDSADYIDWSKSRKVIFSNLKPSTKIISLRLPECLLGEIRMVANKKDVPYQALIKMLLAEGIQSLRISSRASH